jgi:signal transduction histidine kinase
MKIRSRLALQFLTITFGILFIFSLCIYYFSLRNQQREFSMRLRNRALTTAQLLIQVKEVDTLLLNIIDRNTVNALYNEKIAVYDHSNRLVYHHEKKEHPLSIDKEMLDKIRLNKEYAGRIGDEQMVGILFGKKDNPFVVVVSGKDEQGLTQINYLEVLLTVGLLASIAIALLSGWVFAKQMLVPISSVIEQVGRITAKDLTQRVNTGNNNDEISHLAQTFNRMLERLEDAFDMQKKFVANASHELRTPLTAITGQIEVMLKKKRSQEEYEEVLRSILEDARNLGKLTNGLLALAQANAEAAETMIKPVRVDELLWDTRNDLTRAHPGYKINIHFSSVPDEEEKFMIQGSESLLRIAFANLMDNGCKYSKDNKVDVYLSFDNRIRISFKDKGAGIPKDEQQKIFQPFYRGSNVEAIPGNGLGLSLTQRIVKLYHGTISITSEKDKGTTVDLVFGPWPSF